MRVVIDTCVWVAAIRSRRGASFAILSEIQHGRFQFGISVALFLEYRAALTRATASGRSGVRPAQVEAILAALAHYGKEVPIFYRLRPNLKDESDNMVFECAANFGARAIVTHNIRDFRHTELRGYGFELLTPGELLKRMRRNT